MMKKLLYFFIPFILYSCSLDIPEGAEVVKDFQKEKYLGKWYEIARLDHKFERNLNNVTATYSLNDDASIKVINRGFNTEKDKWEEAEGKAKFVGKDSIGQLKVSFFGPFYGSYNIIKLAGDYEVSLVVGSDTDYAWILARTPNISDEVKRNFVQEAKRIGINTEEFIWVEHTK